MKFGVRTLWNKIKAVLANELRANLSPLRASLSLGLGILIGFSPFYGIHTILVLPLAFLFRLNRPLALLATSTTILPFVPLWLAAGIFTGKLIVPVETAGSIIDSVRGAQSWEQFDRMITFLVNTSRHYLPAGVFDAIEDEAGHGVLDGFVQWLIGCSILAVVSALLTFAVSYFIFLHRQKVRREKALS